MLLKTQFYGYIQNFLSYFKLLLNNDCTSCIGTSFVLKL